MDYSNLTGGLRVQSQIPLDIKQYSQSESTLSNLGNSNNLAFTYQQGLVVYCIEEESRWEWREVKSGEENTGLLSNDFTYPDGVITFGIDYSLKSFNFFPYAVDGIQGPQGIQGIQGSQGIQGIQGLTGNDGNTGQDGNDGADGIDGESSYQVALNEGFVGNETEWLLSLVGPQGAQGNEGSQGETGIKGDIGLKGDKGDKGEAGEQGIKGETGLNGPQGIQGPIGLTGPKGDIGMTGVKGDDGPQGLKGDKGDKGDRGFQGVKGDNGLNGINGTNGTQGVQGIQGSQGSKGDQGIQGPIGPGGTGSVGPAGPIGPQGSKGDPGIQGLKGDDGAKGDKGDKGDSSSNILRTNIFNSNYAPSDVKEIITSDLLLPPNTAKIGDVIVIKALIETYNSSSGRPAIGLYIGLNSTNIPNTYGNDEQNSWNLIKLRYNGTENVQYKLIDVEYNIIISGANSCYITAKSCINDVDPSVISEDLNDFYESTVTNPRIARKLIPLMFSPFTDNMYFTLSGYESSSGLTLNVRSFTLEHKTKTI